MAAPEGGGALDGHLEGMIEHVLGQVRESFAAANGGNVTQAFESPYDLAMGFIHAVDWSERWIQALIAAEVALLALVALTRGRQMVQCVIFVLTSCVDCRARARSRRAGREVPPSSWRIAARDDDDDVASVPRGAGPLTTRIGARANAHGTRSAPHILRGEDQRRVPGQLGALRRAAVLR